MNTQSMKKAALFVATVSVLAYPLTSSFTVAAPLQSALPVSSLASGTSVRLTNNSSNAARHNASKVIETPAPAAAPAKQSDKKTVGRCWKRLMDMMREVRQAHHNKK